jgi:hypothetical protein
LLPNELLCEENELECFANVLVSFFETSFEIRTQELNGKVLEARLQRSQVPRPAQRPSGQSKVVAVNAVRRLASDEGIAIDQKIAVRVVNRIDVRADLWIWVYVFELTRRSVGKGKGTVDYRIWHAISPDVRRNLNVDTVWEARSRIVSVIEKAKKM